MIKLKLTILFIILITVSGCSEFALLMSGSSLAINQNTYVKVYNSADVLTIVKTDKDIRKHVYEKGKKRGPKKKHLTGNAYYAAKAKKNFYYADMGKKGGRPRIYNRIEQ